MNKEKKKAVNLLCVALVLCMMVSMPILYLGISHLLTINGNRLKIKHKIVTIEAGQSAHLDIEDFLSGPKDELSKAKFSVSGIDTGKVKTYKGKILYKNQSFPIKIRVADRTAPQYCIQDNTVIKKSSCEIGDFLFNAKDFSETKEGFLSVRQVKKPENITFSKWIDPYKIENTKAKQGEDGVFEEKNLKQTFQFVKDGYYQAEAGGVDQYGNKTTYRFYILVDCNKPVIKFKSSQAALNFSEKNEKIENLDIIKKFTVKDSVDGNLTKKTKVSYNKNFSKLTDGGKLKVSYTVTDQAGNKMEVKKEYPVKIKKDKNVGTFKKRKQRKQQKSDMPKTQMAKSLWKKLNQKKKYYYSSKLEASAQKKAKALYEDFSHTKNWKGAEFIYQGDVENLSEDDVYKKMIKKKISYDEVGIGYYIDEDDVIYWCIQFQ